LNSIEATAGDGNGDSLPDEWQHNVASLISANNIRYLTLAVPLQTSLSGVTALSTGDLGQYLLGVSFPVGLVHFVVNCPVEGMPVTLVFYLPRGISVSSFMNYGPTADNPIPHFYPFLLDNGLGAVMGSQTITLYLKDGGWGDNDLTENGKIEITAGPTKQVTLPSKRERGGIITPIEVEENPSAVEEWMNYE